MNRLARWFYFLRWMRTSVQMLGQRVDVENVLLAVAAGKREPPGCEECKDLARHLAVAGHRLGDTQ